MRFKREGGAGPSRTAAQLSYEVKDGGKQGGGNGGRYTGMRGGGEDRSWWGHELCVLNGDQHIHPLHCCGHLKTSRIKVGAEQTRAGSSSCSELLGGWCQ